MTLSVTRRGSRQRTADLANERVPILDVCRWVGMDVPADAEGARSVRLRCPFGELSHSDGGVGRDFRVYPVNNDCTCFAGCGYFSPVWLAAQAWGVGTTAAATALLDRIGYRPLDRAGAWEAACTVPVGLDRPRLAAALRTYAARVVPGWERSQYDPAVTDLLERCLTLLDLVGDQAGATAWLDTCKRVVAAHTVGAGS